MIEKAQHGLNIMGMPVIFDLPTPLAIKRTQEFSRFRHIRLLQVVLRQVSRRELSGRVPARADQEPGRPDHRRLRANLDATLRLIDQENPSKSELLTASLRPHGQGPRKRSIFPGSNDRAYQVLSTWVQSLSTPKNMHEAAGPQPRPSSLENGEPFAVGRPGTPNEVSEMGMPAIPRSGPVPLAGMPPTAGMPRPAPSASPRRGARPTAHPKSAPDDFPLPFTITGKKPNLAPPLERKIDRGPTADSPRTKIEMQNSRPAPQADPVGSAAGTKLPTAGSPPNASKMRPDEIRLDHGGTQEEKQAG